MNMQRELRGVVFIGRNNPHKSMFSTIRGEANINKGVSKPNPRLYPYHRLFICIFSDVYCNVILPHSSRNLVTILYDASYHQNELF